MQWTIIIFYQGANIFSDQLSNVVFLSYYFILRDFSVLKNLSFFGFLLVVFLCVCQGWAQLDTQKLGKLHRVVIPISGVQWYKLYVHRRCFRWHQNLKSQAGEGTFRWVTFLHWLRQSAFFLNKCAWFLYTDFYVSLLGLTSFKLRSILRP